MEKIDGERYDNTEGLMRDITSLAGPPAQLEKLLDYMNFVTESKMSIPLLDGREEVIKDYIQSLCDNKLPNAFDTVTGTDISVRN
nr:hypothetical protein [Endozoicomonas sp.]